MKKHRIITLLTAAIMGISAVGIPIGPYCPQPIVVEAANNEITFGDFKGTVSNNKITITGYLGTGSSVSIPSTYNGMKITKIANYAFSRKNNFTSVTIGSNVTSIGTCAFYLCKGLKSVTISCKETVIGECAFYECTQLKTVTINGDVRIRSEAFAECKALENVRFNGDFDRYNDAVHDVFTNCINLRKINDNTAAIISQNYNVFPQLSSDETVRAAIQKFFTRSQNVLFVKQYCNDLAKKVDHSETKGWMSENACARQHHDWLINKSEMYYNAPYYDAYHCDENAPEFNTLNGVMLSYGLYNTFYASDEGFARVYQRLLYESLIEAYVVEYQSRQWNVVKIDGLYFNVCVYSDKMFSSGFTVDYSYFLINKSRLMRQWSMSYLSPYTVGDDAEYVQENYNSHAPDDCWSNFPDSNHDGLQNGDWDFKADTASNNDKLIKAARSRALGRTVTEDDLGPFLKELNALNKTPQQYAAEH